MTWLTWRQYRVQAAVAALVLAVFATVLLVTGFQLAAQWHTLLASCTASGTCGNLHQGAIPLGSALGWDFAVLSLMAPALFGVLVGAPLVAHEIEARTCDFAWAQSITRTRWLAVKVGWLLLAAAVWGGAIAALVTWWSGPRNAAFADAFQPNYFDQQGLVPVAYAVFATALGIAAGAVLRRTLPAIAIVIGGFIGMRLWISQGLRMHFMTPVTAFYGVAANFNTPAGSINVGGGLLNKAGAGRDGAARQRDDRRGPEHVAACRLPAADPGQRQRPGWPLRRHAERRLRVPAARRATASSSAISRSAATGRSRASRPASTWRWPPR